MIADPLLPEKGSAAAVMFHHFHGPGHAQSQGSLDVAEFTALIDYIGRDRILPAHEWLQRLEKRELSFEHLCLSFDDGLRSQWDIAHPVLEELGLTAFWFVYTSPLVGEGDRLEVYRHVRNVAFDSVEAFYDAFYDAIVAKPFAAEVSERLDEFDPSSYLIEFVFYSDADRRFRYARDEVLGPDRYAQTMDDLVAGVGLDMDALRRELWIDPDAISRLAADHHVIGLHSHTHPTRMEALDSATQRREYQRNLEVLADITGTRATTMAHPCNSYNATTLRVLGELGVTIGFRSNIAPAGGSQLELPREDHANVLAAMNA